MSQEAPPPTYPTIIPMVAYEDGVAAIEWLVRAFGFRERRGQRIVEDGVVTHAELEHGDGVIMLATPSPDYQGPSHHRQTCEAADRWLQVPWVVDGVLVHVDDLDRHREQAIAAGASMLGEISDGPEGRLYRVEDIEGHRWMFMER
jgi:PhnB protein